MRSLPLRRAYYRLRNHVKGSAADASSLYDIWHHTFFSPTEQIRDLEFLVVDTETSALTTQEGELLSIGWVVIKDSAVDLGSSQHHLLQVEESVGQSAVIHQLRDCELENGISPEAMMRMFLQQVRGRILVFHHADLDMAFLDQLSLQCFGMPLLLPYIDTLQVEKRRLLHKHQAIEKGALRLASCRHRYNLPDYPAHNALMDALATAELLLAQCVGKGRDVRLRDLY
ncbi:exonuclease domain-containing protein [Maricurvus nonylphenolicus]|uniref:3'-5' exonuclease n=1 Tax=Maricurvus nonylphenolicus TaxID=1008307 RepID=UPI0036F219C4